MTDKAYLALPGDAAAAAADERTRLDRFREWFVLPSVAIGAFGFGGTVQALSVFQNPLGNAGWPDNTVSTTLAIMQCVSLITALCLSSKFHKFDAAHFAAGVATLCLVCLSVASLGVRYDVLPLWYVGVAVGLAAITVVTMNVIYQQGILAHPKRKGVVGSIFGVGSTIGGIVASQLYSIFYDHTASWADDNPHKHACYLSLLLLAWIALLFVPLVPFLHTTRRKKGAAGGPAKGPVKRVSSQRAKTEEAKDWLAAKQKGAPSPSAAATAAAKIVRSSREAPLLAARLSSPAADSSSDDDDATVTITVGAPPAPAATEAAAGGAPAGKAGSTGTITSLWDVVRLRQCWLLLVTLFTTQGPTWGLIAFAVPLLKAQLGVSHDVAGRYFMVLLGGNLAGRISWGVLADRFNNKVCYVAMSALNIVLFAAIVAVGWDKTAPGPVVAMLTVVMFIGGGSIALKGSMNMETYGFRIGKVAFGLCNCTTNAAFLATAGVVSALQHADLTIEHEFRYYASVCLGYSALGLVASMLLWHTPQPAPGRHERC